jgi:hypothetical protein
MKWKYNQEHSRDDASNEENIAICVDVQLYSLGIPRSKYSLPLLLAARIKMTLTKRLGKRMP